MFKIPTIIIIFIMEASRFPLKIAIRLGSFLIQDVEKPDVLDFLNKVPTSFSLSDDQVDQLIESGRVLLRNNPEFINLVKDLNIR